MCCVCCRECVQRVARGEPPESSQCVGEQGGRPGGEVAAERGRAGGAIPQGGGNTVQKTGDEGTQRRRQQGAGGGSYPDDEGGSRVRLSYR